MSPRLIALLLLPLAAGDWEMVRKREGLTLEKRRIAGERFDELRVRVPIRAPRQKLLSYLMSGYVDKADEGIERKIVKRTADTVVWTDLIRTPIISERCATIQLALRDNGVVSFQSLADWPIGKPNERCVPIRTKGQWTVEATGDQSILTYTVFADPGGKLPAFLIRGAMEDDAVKRVQRLIAAAVR